MKKFSKIVGAIAGVLAVIGIVMICIGALGGGASIVKQASSNEKVEIISELMGLKSKLNFVYNDDINFSSGYQVFKNETGEFTSEGEVVKALNVEISGGEIEMSTHMGSDWKVIYESMGKIQIYAEDGTLYIRGEKEGVKVDFGTITILAPQDAILDKAEIELGVGSMDIASMQAENFKVSVGAGELQVGRLNSHTAELEVGAGEISIRDGEVTDLYASVGMGEIDMNGNILGNVDAEVAMGALELEIYNSTETDHNYELSCAAGEMLIGSKEYAGLGVSTDINNGADTTYKLDCAMGSMELKFTGGR